MRIQIDFDNKLVKVCDTVNLYEFFDKLKETLPNGLWKTFSLNQVENVYYACYPTYGYGKLTTNVPQWEPYRWIVTNTSGTYLSSSATGIVNIEVGD